MRKATAGWRRRGAGWALAACALPGLAACGLLGGGRGTPAADPVEEARIRGEVEARLAAEPSIRAGQVRVEVAGRTVSLHGAVEGFGALRCAVTNAGLVRGVENVADLLVLDPGPSTVRCLAPRAAPSDARTPAARP